MSCREDLHAYQERAVDMILEKRKAFLALDMGIGKTVISLTAITDLLDSCSTHRVLIVGPLRVVKTVWRQEAKKWSHTRHHDIKVCIGSPKDRLKVLHQAPEIMAINRENVVWLVKHFGKKWPFDTVIIDESSSFKNPQSKRFKALKSILDLIDNIVLLTGTPSPNGLLDVWSQSYLIDQGESLGRTYTGYRTRFFNPDYNGYTFELRDGAEEIIHSLLKPYTLRMAAEDYLEMPDRIDLIESIDLSQEEMASYRKFEEELFLSLDDGEVLEAPTAAVLANKLLQYANGNVYTDDLKNWSAIHSAKLDRLEELLADNPNETVLVAYNYKSDLTRLQERFPKAVVMDSNEETVNRWNRGEIQMLLAHPQSSGMGLNLQKGGQWLIWYGLTWSLENYLQFNARLYRQGQELPVRISHLVCAGTIDERVMAVIGDKDATQSRLLSALK